MITLPPGLSILNCQAGDIKVSFDKDNPQEAARAERVVKDMLKRGYIIFAYDAANKLHRVNGFDPETNEYILADGATYEPTDEEAAPKQEEAPHGRKKDGTPKKRPGRGGRNRLPAETSRAVGVARTAGG